MVYDYVHCKGRCFIKRMLLALVVMMTIFSTSCTHPSSSSQVTDLLLLQAISEAARQKVTGLTVLNATDSTIYVIAGYRVEKLTAGSTGVYNIEVGVVVRIEDEKGNALREFPLQSSTTVTVN